jgi:glyoxylase-like metal-dependent hydrolase (beta-lactamase superfamily II)
MKKIHHLNCGSLFPLFPRGTQSILYCLLVETNDGLLLVDTGFGFQDYVQPTIFIKIFMASLGMHHQLEETAVYQVERLGYSRKDVKHIVLTHLHCDHSGGLRDFPDARVHVHKLEYEAALSPKGFKERFYEPEHWAHGPEWVVHDEGGEENCWFGFRSIRVQEGLSPDVRLIPLHGHSRGHCGVAIQTSTGWLFHCGDATYPFYHENKPAGPIKPLPFYVMSPPKWLERSLIGEQTPRLKKLHKKHSDEIHFICSNDSISYSRQATSS